MPVFSRRAWVAAGATAAVLLLGWVALLVAVLLQARRNDAGPADAVVVLGAAQYNGHPSPAFRARLDHAATVYGRGLAPMVLVTGGIGEGDSLSEAEVGVAYLHASGLPPQVVAAVPRGRTTYASLAAAAEWLAVRDRHTALLVSDDFHLLRLRLIASQLRLVARTSPVPDSPLRRNTRRYLGLVLAETVKIPIALLLRR